jgi:transposase InsO family protein
VVGPSAKRLAVQLTLAQGHGNTAQVCRALNLGRSTFYRAIQKSEASRRLENAIVAKSQDHPRYGYRRVTVMLRRDGHRVNEKRTQRVRRAEGLQVKKKQRRMRRLGESTGERRKARRPGEVWSWDFVHDMTEHGSRFRMLTLIDEYTRQCLAIHPGWSIRARDVIAIVSQTMKREGQPVCLRSDNGPEFIAYAVKDRLADLSVRTIYITPGSPWEQGHIESFHDKFKDECLNRELFGSLAAARVIVEQWRKEYNQQRPHSSLSYRTPDEFAEDCNRRLQSGCALLPSPIAKDRDINQPTNNPAALDF